MGLGVPALQHVLIPFFSYWFFFFVSVMSAYLFMFGTQSSSINVQAQVTMLKIH